MPSAEETAHVATPVASFQITKDAAHELLLKISGSLNAEGVALLWEPTIKLLSSSSRDVHIDVSDVSYCDSTGAVFLIYLKRLVLSQKCTFEFVGLKPEHSKTLDIFSLNCLLSPKEIVRRKINLAEHIGEVTCHIFHDLRNQLIFLGQLCVALYEVLTHPRQLHFKKILKIFQAAAVEALPIIGLISFLVGMIIATQAAGPLKSYGAEIHVIYLVSLIMFRELSAIMTAILLAGRTGSAFAAEIGTMKVNEELNALHTMGLDPIRFLVVERVIAGVLAMPFLTIYSMFIGAGASFLVMLCNGYSMPVLYAEMLTYCNITDIMEGLLKSFFFGALVAGVGCLRGIQTSAGASSVGESATRSVVSAIVLIIANDSIFTIISTTLRGAL